MIIRIPKLGSVIIDRDKGQALITADQVWATNLRAIHYRNGRALEERDLGSGVITTAGAILLAAGATTLGTFSWHDSGASTQSPLISDTGLYLPIAGQVRVQGVGLGIAQIYQTVGLITYNSPQSISEWGLFSALTNGTMLDRRTFTAFTILTNDAIQFIYQLTVQSGG